MTDADAHLLNMGKPMPATLGQSESGPIKRKTKKKRSRRNPAAQPNERNKWSQDHISTLQTAMSKHGTNFTAIAEDEEFKTLLGPSRSVQSVVRAYHKHIPAGQQEKKQQREARDAKKAAALASGQHFSDTSSDDDSGSDSDSDSGSDSDSDSDSGSGSSSSDEGPHPVNNPPVHHHQTHSHTHHNTHNTVVHHPHNPQPMRHSSKPRVGPGGVLEESNVPIEPWEKPANDKRDDSFFCRCRHVCGCRSTSSEGRPWVNGQAVMVRGSRRNHETNQKLHPDCNKNSPCWALLHSLKDARQSKGQLQSRRSMGESDNEDDRMGKKRKRSHDMLPSLMKSKQDDMYDDHSMVDSRSDPTVPVSHALFQEMLEQCQVLNMTIRSVHATSPLLTANVSDLATALVQANARIAEQQAHIEQLSQQVDALNTAMSHHQPPPPPPISFLMGAPPGGMSGMPGMPGFAVPPPPPSHPGHSAPPPPTHPGQ